MKTKLFTLMLLLVSINLYSQQWHLLNGGTTENLNSVNFRLSYQNTYAGWAVGENNTGIATQDGGNNWYSSIVSNANNKCVYFTIVDFGHVAGSGYRVWGTDVGGLWWYPQNPPFAPTYYGVWFDYRYNGWAVGTNGVIIQTQDEGWNWFQNSSGVNVTLNSIDGIDSNKVWAVGDSGVILNTMNGGLNWNVQTSNSNSNLKSVTFSDSLNGWACGSNGVVLHTSNAGLIWNQQVTPTVLNLNGVYFVDDLHGWVVGDSGVILSTSNGGNSWSFENSGVTAKLNSVHFYNLLTGWAVGNNGTIIKYGTATGVDELSASKNVSIYPNPASEKVVISYSLPHAKEISIELFDAMGKKVKEKIINNIKPEIKLISFDIREIPNGIYTLQIKNGENNESRKIIILHE